MHPMLTIAVRAARKAGNLIAKNYETPDAVEASQKGPMTSSPTSIAMQSI